MPPRLNPATRRQETHLFHHVGEETLCRLERLLNQAERYEIIMATSREALEAIRASNTKADSMILFLADIKNQLDEALADTNIPAEVQADIDAIFDEGNAQAAETGAAMAENTPPVEPEPVE